MVVGGGGADGVEGYGEVETVGPFVGLGWWVPWSSGRRSPSVVTQTLLESFRGG